MYSPFQKALIVRKARSRRDLKGIEVLKAYEIQGTCKVHLFIVDLYVMFQPHPRGQCSGKVSEISVPTVQCLLSCSFHPQAENSVPYS